MKTQRNMVGSQGAGGEGEIEFNNKGLHTLPSFYSGLSNAIRRSRAQSMKHGDPEKYGR